MFLNRLRLLLPAWGLLSLSLAVATPNSAFQAKTVEAELAPLVARQNAAGTPAPSDTLHLVFALNSVKADQLKAYAESVIDPGSPNYRHWLTPEQVGQRFGASQSDIDAVVSYAQSQGMTVKPVLPTRMFVSVTAPVHVAERSFAVHLLGFERTPEISDPASNGFFFAPAKAPQLPAGVATKVKAIFGLSSAFRMQHAPVAKYNAGFIAPPALTLTPDAAVAFGSALSPAQVSKFYDFDAIKAAGWTGSGHTIAIFSPTNFNPSDVIAFATNFGITGYTVSQVNIDGGPGTNFNGQDEACLDGEIVLGQAQANVVYFQSPNTGAAAIDVFSAIQNANYEVLTNSWDFSEATVVASPSFLNAIETILAGMTSQGIAHYSASGDNGAAGGVGYPNTSPNVTSVGGTDNLLQVAGVYSSEQGWTGSGGGLSKHFTKPSWQAGPGVSNTKSTGFRQVPDVSALGGPHPGYLIFMQGAWYQAWGTSASTPLWASSELLLNQASGSRLGNLNATLYYIGTNLNALQNGFVFHDVRAGNNGFAATSWWDYVTGWGSADFGKLYADMLFLPDLTPAIPTGFKSPLAISASSTSQTPPATYHETITYYVSGGVKDLSTADAIATQQDIALDGTHHFTTGGPFQAGTTVAIKNLYSLTLPAGSHTFTLTANSGGSVIEASTANNVYSVTINVLPALTGFSLPATGTGGTSIPVTLTISSPAPTGGAKIKVVSSVTTDVSAQYFTIPAGSTSLAAKLKTLAVTVSTPQTLTATYGLTKQTAPLTLTP